MLLYRTCLELHVYSRYKSSDILYKNSLAANVQGQSEAELSQVISDQKL